MLDLGYMYYDPTAYRGTSEGENLANVNVLYQSIRWWRIGSGCEQSTL